jgi:hypothetical protein
MATASRAGNLPAITQAIEMKGTHHEKSQESTQDYGIASLRAALRYLGL